jgi:hypothetical protein
MKAVRFILLFLCASLYASVLEVEKGVWAHAYKIHFSKTDQKQNSKRKAIICEKTNVPLFTQIIFSWNALRPKNGKLTFYSQVRDKETQQWDKSWNKMAEWGNNIQKSFFSRSSASVFQYARLEAIGLQGGDGFRIKVVAENSHDLSLVQHLNIALSDFKKFTPESYKKRAQGLPSFMLTNVPQESQMILEHPKADTLCSPTSISMIVGSLIKKDIDPLEFAHSVHDTGLNIYGNWAFNMAHAFEQCKGKAAFYATRLDSFTDLYKLLKKQVPVAVSIRGPLKGSATPYEKGHILVVVGWDAKKREVICHDPAFDTIDQVYTRYDINEFIVAWERSRRLTYKTQLLV